jgi:hypothetical protein
MNKQHTVSITGMSKIVAIGIIAMIATMQLSNNGSVMAALVNMEMVERKAPIAIVGDNVYIAWPTNRTGNDEVNFRASIDGGATFADKINLSNSTGAESQDVEIAGDGDNVIITWWERNATSNEPVVRMSTDNGATFGPLLKLAANGTIGETAEEG